MSKVLNVRHELNQHVGELYWINYMKKVSDFDSLPVDQQTDDKVGEIEKYLVENGFVYEVCTE